LFLALPRKGLNPQILGGLLVGAAVGLLLVVLGIRTAQDTSAANLPNVYFYVFAAIALGAGLRVITHPKPVYAALYFILTVISSGGIFLILSAEFMAFALIIVYAGAILITYLFVIMLATQGPTEENAENLAEYDTQAREPLAAAGVAFLLLAVLTTLSFRGVGQLPPPQDTRMTAVNALSAMPRKVERALERTGAIQKGDRVEVDPTGRATFDFEARTIVVRRLDGRVEAIALPEGFDIRNVEELGFNLLGEHPGTIEIAGVILLMAMLGAVVLSRKQVELDEDAKRQHAETLAGEVGVSGGTGA
jgi:NADH-quinone oxidoreductase subunit J